MCFYVLVGAEADEFELRELLSADGMLDTSADAPPNRSCRERFPRTDSVVCVTLEGCSCALLETPLTGKVGRRHQRERDAFYRALTRATLRFGSIRLLVTGSETSSELASSHREGTTTLRELLASRRPEARGLLRVVA